MKIKIKTSKKVPEHEADASEPARTTPTSSSARDPLGPGSLTLDNNPTTSPEVMAPVAHSDQKVVEGTIPFSGLN
jgi:hypothetical protein